MEFYIQNKGFVGNCMAWWRIGKSGYTCDLDQAQKFSDAEAENICRSRPDEDRKWPVELVDRLAKRHLPIGAYAEARDEAKLVLSIKDFADCRKD